MWQRQTAFDLDTFLQGSGRGAGELQASLDSHGMTRIHNARSGVNHCVAERPCASRSCSLRHALDETRTPAPGRPGAGVSRWDAGTGVPPSMPRCRRAYHMLCARTSRTNHILRRTSAAAQGNAHDTTQGQECKGPREVAHVAVCWPENAVMDQHRHG